MMMTSGLDLEAILHKNKPTLSSGRVEYGGQLEKSYQPPEEQHVLLDLYPSDVVEKDGVVLRKVSPYVIGSSSLLGVMNTYSRQGMVLEGLTGEFGDRVVDHEVKRQKPEILKLVGKPYKFLPKQYSSPTAVDIFGPYVVTFVGV
jgi:hypothetical protein